MNGIEQKAYIDGAALAMSAAKDAKKSAAAALQSETNAATSELKAQQAAAAAAGSEAGVNADATAAKEAAASAAASEVQTRKDSSAAVQAAENAALSEKNAAASKEAAATAAEQASAEASAAADSASKALNSQLEAATLLNKTKNSASEAAASASDAAVYADEASAYLSSSQASAGAAAASAVGAKTSETEAKNQASAAQASALAATEQTTLATEQASKSAASAVNAATSADNALVSANKAETQAVRAENASTAAANSATQAAEQATAATGSASAAGMSAIEAGAQADTAAEHATKAETQAKAAADSAAKALESQNAAAQSVEDTKKQTEEAAAQANAAAAAASSAESSAASASEAVAAAEAAGADQAAIAKGYSESAQLAEAKSLAAEQRIVDREASYIEHMASVGESNSMHMTVQEHENLIRLVTTFPAVDPDTPATPDPTIPQTAVDWSWIRNYFAKNAQPGVAQAPPAVYVSRVPLAYQDAEGTWMNYSSTIAGTSYNATSKFMDNAGLQHTCSTDVEEGVDDYNGKLWPFFWQHGNYLVDDYGNKHITAVKGQQISGVKYNPALPTCAFGPAFYFFCKGERYQDPATGYWTTDDTTEAGNPIYQLWGISACAFAALDQSRQEELNKHGIYESDFHLWDECYIWNETEQKKTMRPYWIHSAYGGTSIKNEPQTSNLSHNLINTSYENKPNRGGGAAVNGFGMLFDIVKNATKDSQSIHKGMSSNSNGAVMARYATLNPDYIFPISSQGAFERGGTVWLWQTSASSAGGTPAGRDGNVRQIGRIKSIETRSVTKLDGTVSSTLCLVFDPETVHPFVTRTTIDDTKALTDEGTYACCYATQGMALSGETDWVLGKHDGSVNSNTSGRHPYRVQGTEYMPGTFICAADVVAFKGTGSIAVDVHGEISIPTTSQYIYLQAGITATRKQSGNLQNYLDAGYIPVGVGTAAGGYILNEQLSPEGVPYPILVGGSVAGSGSGHGDNMWVGANPAEYLSGGRLDGGDAAGSASLALTRGLGFANWDFGSRP